MTKENIVDEIRFLAWNLTEHSYENHILEFSFHQQFVHREDGRPVFEEDGSGKAKKTKDSDLGVTTKEGLYKYTKSFLKDPATKLVVIKKDGLRLALYNARDNVLAIIDTNGENLGTIFRPERGRHKFKDIMREAKDWHGKSPVHVIDGGYVALREKFPKKSIFNDPTTAAHLNEYLKKNGRTPLPPPAAPVIDTKSEETPLTLAKLLACRNNLAFIVEGKVPMAVIFNETNRTLVLATEKKQELRSFATEAEAYSAFNKIHVAEESKANEPLHLLDGNFPEIAQQFEEKTGVSLIEGIAKAISDKAKKTDPDEEDISFEKYGL